MTNKSLHNKKGLIEALKQSHGIVTSACEAVGVSRVTYYDYYKTDEEFRNEVDDISNMALDFAETKLHSRIDSGDTTAIIFYLKTKGKHRGYVEKQEIEQTGSVKIIVEYAATKNSESNA